MGDFVSAGFITPPCNITILPGVYQKLYYPLQKRARASLPQFSTWRGGVDAIWAPRFISAVECAMRVRYAQNPYAAAREGRV